MKKIILAALGIAALSGCASHPDHSANQTQICEPITESQVIGLFDRWNNSLQTGDPKAVVANYAPRSILLPTVSNQNRLTPQKKRTTSYISSKTNLLGKSQRVKSTSGVIRLQIRAITRST